MITSSNLVFFSSEAASPITSRAEQELGAAVLGRGEGQLCCWSAGGYF